MHTNKQTNKQLIKFIVCILVILFPLFAYSSGIDSCSTQVKMQEVMGTEYRITYNPANFTKESGDYCTDFYETPPVNKCYRDGYGCKKINGIIYYPATNCQEVQWYEGAYLTVYAYNFNPKTDTSWINGRANYISSQKAMCCGKNFQYCGDCYNSSHDIYWDSYASNIVDAFNSQSNSNTTHYYLTINTTTTQITKNTYCSEANTNETCKTWEQCPDGGIVSYNQYKYQLQRCLDTDNCYDISEQSDLTNRPIYKVYTSANNIQAYKITDINCINKIVTEVKTEDDCYKLHKDNEPGHIFNDKNSDNNYNENETFTDNTGTYILTENTDGKCYFNSEQRYCSVHSGDPECLTME